MAKTTGMAAIRKLPLRLILAASLALPIAACNPKPTADTVLAGMEKEEPVYGVIRQRYPAQYAEIKGVITSAMAANAVAQGKLRIRHIVIDLMHRKLPNASDKSLLELISIVRDEARSVSDRNPEVCVALLKGESADFGRYFSKGLIARENALYAALLSEPDDQRFPPASQAKIQAFMGKAAANIQAQLKLERPALAAALQFRGPVPVQCQAGAGLMDQLVQSQEPERFRIMRTLMASS